MNKFEKIGVIFTGLITLSYSITASSISVGDLVISEIMVNPTFDATGEWFEIFNTTAFSIDLTGVVLFDDGADLHAINDVGPVIIQSGEYFVLGSNGDFNLNGGYIADYVYSNFLLGNSGDEIVMSMGGVEIARLNYTVNFDVAGRSRILDFYDGTSPIESDYINASDELQMAGGDFGSPGAPGNITLPVSAVPIPGAVWLFGSGLFGLIGLARRRVHN